MVPFEEFCALIQNVTRTKRPISRGTDIVHDLGMAGIDGDKLAAALSKTYGFTLTDDEIDRTSARNEP